VLAERGFHPPSNWNSLPKHLHYITDTELFKRCLETELFMRAHGHNFFSAFGHFFVIGAVLMLLYLYCTVLSSCDVLYGAIF